jgi:hypothetical protein
MPSMKTIIEMTVLSTGRSINLLNIVHVILIVYHSFQPLLLE